MLSAFCKALELTGAASKIKRFVLVTGAKNYGVHLGRVKIPMQETDPRWVLRVLDKSEGAMLIRFQNARASISPQLLLPPAGHPI
jgi:hypothetical protein